MPSSASAPRVKRYNAKQRGGNTYKFQGFNERINSIRLNLHHPTALHASSHPSTPTTASPAASHSHFADELERQRELDASAPFTACYRQLRPLCRSFALVMHHKRRIVRILITTLQQPAILSPAPYLSLLTTLVRDLRFDIYPLFPYILTSLLALLQPSSPDHLHALFSALLYLFKYLARQLTRDVVLVYTEYMSALLRHERWYVRRFAAESFAYLVRKVREDKRHAVYEAMLQWPADDTREEEHEEEARGEAEEEREEGEGEVSDETLRREAKRAMRASALHLDEYRAGVASVLFHTHRTVEHSFHSSAAASLPVLLSFLRPASAAPADAALSAHRSLVLTAFFRQLANYTRREQSELVWTALHTRWQLLSQQWPDESDGDRQWCRSIELARLLELLALWTAFRKGQRIHTPQLVLSVCQSSMRPPMLQSPQQTGEYKQAAIRLLCAFTPLAASAPHRQQLQLLLAQLFSPRSSLEPPPLAELVERLRRVDGMDGLLVRWVFGYVQARARAEGDAGREERRGEWLRLVLLACQHYRLHDDFYYAERQREQPQYEAAEEEVKLNAVSRLISRLPTAVVGEAVREVVAAMARGQLDEGEVERVHAALQVLVLTGAEDVHALLSDGERQRVRSVIAEQKPTGLSDGTELDDGDEEDEEQEGAISLQQLLTAFAIHIHSLLPALPHPSSHPPLPLFAQSTPSPLHHHSAAPTSAAVDSHLYLATRAIVSSHLLLGSQRPTASLLLAQHRALLELLQRYGAHPAVLRPLLSLLSAVSQDSAELPHLKAALLSQQRGQQLMERLSSSLAHPSATVRLLSLHILSLYPPLDYLPATTNSASTLTGACPLVSQLLQLSLFQARLVNERQLEKLLAQVEVFIASRRLPPPYVRLLLPALLGQLRLKMASVWARVQRCVAALMAGYAAEVREEWLAEMRRSEEETRVLVSEQDRRRMDGNGEAEPDAVTESHTAADSANTTEEPAVDEQPTAEAMPEGVEDDAAAEEDDDDESAGGPAPPGFRSVSGPPRPALGSPFTRTASRATDIHTYHALLHRTLLLEDAKPFADKQSAPLASLFLLFFHTEYALVYPAQDRMSPVALLPADEAVRAAREQQVRVAIPSARKQAKVKLLHFLRLFHASFASLHALEPFRAYFPVFLYRLLVHHDGEVQSLALKCLAKYKYASLTPYLPSLLRLVDEGTYREEMATFHLSPAVSAVERAHRPQLSAVLVRLLFAKMEKGKDKDKRGKRSAADRRSVLLAYLAGLQEDEVTALVAIMLQPWQPLIRQAAGETEESASGQAEDRTAVKSKKDKRAEDEQAFAAECASHLPTLQPSLLARAITGEAGQGAEDVALAKQVGFLRLLETLLSQMRSVVQRYLPHVCLVLLRMLTRVTSRIDAVKQRRAAQMDDAQPEGADEDDEEEAADEADGAVEAASGGDDKREYKLLRTVRQLIYARFATILDLYPFHFQPASPTTASPALSSLSSAAFTTSVHVDLAPFLSSFLSLTAGSVAALPAEQTQHKAGLLSVIGVLASHAELLPALLSSDVMLPAVFGLLAATRVAPEVVRAVLSICEKLLAREAEGREAVDEERIEARRDKRIRAANSAPNRSTQRTLTREERRHWDSSDEDEDEDNMDDDDERSGDERQSIARRRADTKRLAAAVSAAWSAHISGFLRHMHTHLSAASASSYPRRELSIIASVASHARDADTVDKLTALLLPLLGRLNKTKQRQLSREGAADEERRGASKADMQHSILSILHSTIRLHPSPASLAPPLSRHFMLLASPANRALLADTFLRASERLPQLRTAAALLVELTAVSSLRVGEMDYDRMVSGYAQLRAREAELGGEGEAVLLFALLQHVNEDEMGVRGQAVDAIKRMCGAPGGGKEHVVTEVVYPAIKRGQLTTYTQTAADVMTNPLCASIPLSGGR